MQESKTKRLSQFETMYEPSLEDCLVRVRGREVVARWLGQRGAEARVENEEEQNSVNMASFPHEP